MGENRMEQFNQYKDNIKTLTLPIANIRAPQWAVKSGFCFFLSLI